MSTVAINRNGDRYLKIKKFYLAERLRRWFISALLLSIVFGLCRIYRLARHRSGERRLPRGYAAYKVGDRPPSGRVGDSRLCPAE